MFKEVIKALETREQYLEPHTQAEDFQAGQNERWHDIFVRAAGQSVFPKECSQLLSDISWIIRSGKHPLFKTSSNANGSVFRAEIPILNTESYNTLNDFFGNQPHAALAAIICETGITLEEHFGDLIKTENPNDPKKSILGQLIFQPVSFYVSQYFSEKFYYSSDVYQKAEEQQWRDVQLDNRQNTLDAAINDAAKQLEDAIRKHEGTFDCFKKEKEADFKSLMDSFQEQNSLEAATTVWSSKVKGHQRAFRWSFFLLVFVIGSLLGAALYWRHEVFSLLRTLAPDGGDLRYGFLVLLLIPILAIGWLLRIGGKIATQALTLKADAEQRSALVDTYLSLVADPKAGIDKNDRAIVLNALFRPLPGETEDILPPNVLELIKDRIKKE